MCPEKLCCLCPLGSLCWKHLLTQLAPNILVPHTWWAQDLSWSVKLEKVRLVKNGEEWCLHGSVWSPPTACGHGALARWPVYTETWCHMVFEASFRKRKHKISLCWKYKISLWYLYVVYWTNKNLDELSQIKYIVAISFTYFFVH